MKSVLAVAAYLGATASALANWDFVERDGYSQAVVASGRHSFAIGCRPGLFPERNYALLHTPDRPSPRDLRRINLANPRVSFFLVGRPIGVFEARAIQWIENRLSYRVTPNRTLFDAIYGTGGPLHVRVSLDLTDPERTPFIEEEIAEDVTFPAAGASEAVQAAAKACSHGEP